MGAGVTYVVAAGNNAADANGYVPATYPEVNTVSPVAGDCVNTPIVCNDKNPCTGDACDPASGCVFTFNRATCTTEDGEPGTCGSGVCAEDNPGDEPCETFVCENPLCAVRGPGMLDICACFRGYLKSGQRARRAVIRRAMAR